MFGFFVGQAMKASKGKANPKLFNEMVVENGKVKQGSLARIEPEGQVTRMWEAIETYMERKQPLIIIAGADYGQGSSRDWAAKGVRLAGVEAIAAEGLERIHRTNLVGMGVCTASAAGKPSSGSCCLPPCRRSLPACIWRWICWKQKTSHLPC